MSSSSDFLANLKVEINSVLVSGGSELNIHQLQKDFYELNRKQIPYREAGYTSIEELVQGIPDAVSCRWVSGQLRVRAVSNESVGHLVRLVGLNKRKPKSSYRRMQPPPRLQDVPVIPLPVATNGAQSFPAATNGAQSFPVATNGDQSFKILRGQILDLMFSYRKGLKGSQFVDAFAKRFGNYRMLTNNGFSSIEKLLEAMPDVVEIVHDRNRRDFVVYGRREKRRPHDPRTGSPPRTEYSTDVFNPGNTMSNAVPANSFENYANGIQDTIADNIPEDDGLELADNEFDSFLEFEELKVKVQQVLSFHPKGLFASKFMTEFQRIVGQKLKLKAYDCITVIDVLLLMPDTVVIERPSNGDWMVFDKRTFRKELVKQNHSEDLFPSTPTFSDFQANLRIVLEKYCDGVLLSELETVYENVVHQLIDAKQLGFSNIDKLLEAVGGMVELNYIREGRVLLKLSKITARISAKSPFCDTSSLGVGASCPSEVGIPLDAVPLPFVYRDQDPPESSPKDVKYTEVVVSDVTSPSRFWFQLSSMKNSLNELMDNLQKFYRRPASQTYAVPGQMLKVGLSCVALYPENKEWHRSIILSIENEAIKVAYVDYGTEGTVTASSLRLITWSFLSFIPRQALRASLAKIKPANETWTPEAISQFFNMVVDRQLLAVVTEYSADDGGCCYLYLCDTTGSEDIHINDHLLLEGHAVMVTSDDADDKNADSDDLIFDSDVDECDFDGNPDDAKEMEDLASSKSTLNVNAKPFAYGEAYYKGDNLVRETSSAPRHLCKFFQLTTKYGMHLLNIEDKPYLISTEVALLLGKDDDLFRSMLRNMGKANLPKLVLTIDEHSDLIRQLVSYQLPGTTLNGEPREILVLYELSSVIIILELFNHESEELKIAVQRQFDLFNPNDPYWTGQTDAELTYNKSNEYEEWFSNSWNRLQKLREKYLSQMKTESPSGMAALITQLEKTESELQSLRNSYERSLEMKSVSERSLQSGRTNPAVVSVGDVILQQGRSYLAQNSEETTEIHCQRTGSAVVPAVSAVPKNAVSCASDAAPSNSHAVDALSSNLSLMSVNPALPPPPYTPVAEPLFAGIPRFPGQFPPGNLVPGYSALPTFSSFRGNAVLLNPIAYDASGFASPMTNFYPPAPRLLPSLSALNYQYFYSGGTFLQN